MSFWHLQFPPKNKRRQGDLRFHSTKVESDRLYFGGNVVLKKLFRLCLIFSKWLKHVWKSNIWPKGYVLSTYQQEWPGDLQNAPWCLVFYSSHTGPRYVTERLYDLASITMACFLKYRPYIINRILPAFYWSILKSKRIAALYPAVCIF